MRSLTVYGCLFVAIILFGFTSAVLAFSDEELNYQQCLLDHQPKARLEQVVARVRHACDKVHRDNLMVPRKINYFRCLLDYLPPVETEGAMQDVLGACASMHDFRR
jgi:hypothetical protein